MTGAQDPCVCGCAAQWHVPRASGSRGSCTTCTGCYGFVAKDLTAPTGTKPPAIDTTQVRRFLEREPARTRGTARLIQSLCDEIDRLRAREAVHG